MNTFIPLQFRGCEFHVCPEKYFKCPMSYCLPRHLECDGKWHCPGGAEEASCQRETCPGLIKCRNSVICISTESVCNSVYECPLMEDEYFCDSSIPVCPEECLCLLYSLSKELSKEGDFLTTRVILLYTLDVFM